MSYGNYLEHLTYLTLLKIVVDLEAALEQFRAIAEDLGMAPEAE